MKFVFITYNNTTASMHMRGTMPAQALRRAGHDVYCVTHGEVENTPMDQNTICVVVKVINQDVISYIKRRRAKIAYDMIDNWNWNNLNSNFDYVIASNESHAQHIKKFYNGKIIIIPHLHTNVARRRKSIPSIKTIGYIGMVKQFDISNEMLNFCIKRNFTWFQAGGSKIATVENETMKLDLGVIYISQAMEKLGLKYEYIRNFKPATKLTNLFSYGIPCLFNPTVSFMEVVASDPGLNFLVVRNKNEIFSKIDKLYNNFNKFKELSDRCYSIANNYHLDNADKYYSRLFTI